jgi:hypothetical protein
MHKLGAPVASPAFAKVDMLLLDYDFYGLSAFLNIHYFMNNHDDQECRTGDRRSQPRMPDWRPALPGCRLHPFSYSQLTIGNCISLTLKT